MAESKPTETKTASAPTAKPTKSEGVTLYRADGRERTVTDPSVQTRMEFSGWSADKSVFNKKKK